MSKRSLVMARPNPHHPTNSLSVIGDSLAQYLLLTSFSNSNPYPHYFPRYTRSINMCKIIPQKCVLYQIILLIVIHYERTTSKRYTVRVLHTDIHTAVLILLSFYWLIFNTHHYWGSGNCFPIVFLRYTNISGRGFKKSNIIFKITENKCSLNYFRGCILSVILN